MTPDLPDYRPGLAAAAVDRGLRQSLVACDHAQAAVVLWLAEVVTRGLHRKLGHPSPLQYATEGLGMSRSRAYDLLQLARDLDRLPRLRDAIATRRVGWTKARLVARVATAATEARWVEAAQTLGRRDLAGRVASEFERARTQREARRRTRAATVAGQSALVMPMAPIPLRVRTLEPARPAGGPPVPATASPPSAATRAASPPPGLPVAVPLAEPILGAAPPVTVTHRFTAIEHARYEALSEQVRRRRCVPACASREQLLLSALSALASTAGASSRLDAAIHYQIIIYRCTTCAAAEVVSRSGRRELTSAEFGAVQCDARVLEAGQPNRATIPPSTRAAVLARDGHRCQGPGCTETRFLEVHHVTPRSAGGSNAATNLLTLCGRCHRFVHERPELALQWSVVAARKHEAGPHEADRPVSTPAKEVTGPPAP